MNAPAKQQFGDITCGDLALVVKPFFRQHTKTLLALTVLTALWMAVDDRAGLIAFAAIAAGGLLPIILWSGEQRPGLPLAPLVGLQSLIVHVTPVVVQNPTVFRYGADAVNAVAFEVFLFGIGIAGGWRFATRNVRPAFRPTFHKFSFLGEEKDERLALLGPTLLGCGVAYLLVNQLGYLELLPSGAISIARAMADAAAIGGSLLGGYFSSISVMSVTRRIIFWLLLTAHCLLIISNYTLFPAAGVVIAMLIGVFLGRGRLPLVPLVLIGLVFAFLNLTKFEMRRKYWEEGTAYAYQQLSDLPKRYAEWAELSFKVLTAEEDPTESEARRETQRLSERVNNLVNLLDARAAMTEGGVKPFGGGSYTIIPMLLIPRMVWPEKPRTHEGMVQLNIHFGRQTREDSLVTYISWGLLPEAYANFGAIWGALLCGLVLGAATGVLEFWARPYPLTSLEALVFLCLAVQVGISFEMVASVWLTSVFQMIVALIGGTALFVTKTKSQPPS